MKKVTLEIGEKTYIINEIWLSDGDKHYVSYSPDEEQVYDLTEEALQENWRVWGHFWVEESIIHLRIMGSHTPDWTWALYIQGETQRGITNYPKDGLSNRIVWREIPQPVKISEQVTRNGESYDDLIAGNLF